MLAGLKGGISLKLNILRGNKEMEITYTPLSKSLENPPQSIIEYGNLTLRNGQKVRTIITKPKNKIGKLPAIFLVQWLSCSSVEIVGEPSDGADLLIKHFSQHPDFVMMRVEKLGVGDSDGSCADCDLNTEMEMNKIALEYLRKREDVDNNHIYLLGLSLGAGLSAVLGQSQNIKGYIVSGACTVTWFEHMMELERRRLAFLGESFPQINAKMSGYATLYQKYYIEQMTPEDVIKQHPSLKNLWYEDPQHQYGRPAQFYQQVQALNFEKAWSEINVPTLVIYGEYDWIMGLADHEKIIKLVNQNGANLAELFVLPKADHNLQIFESQQKAFDGEGGMLPKNLIEVVENWWRKQKD
jgi:pimeloyl-ACP methyl ester carboxylesterase